MDFDSSSKFVASLAKFLQSLCNGYVDFDKGVEVIGHIHINVDSDLGKKVDYVLNERVCKNNNSITFISNSFPAQPAEKPSPPKESTEKENDESEQSVVMNDSGQMLPNSTNVGTIGSYRNPASRNNSFENPYSPSLKRPRSPQQRVRMGFSGNSHNRHSFPQSPRYQDSSGPSAKLVRTDSGASFHSGGDDEDNFSNHGSSDVEQKPCVDPDLSIVKEEHRAGGSQYLGPDRSNSQAIAQYPQTPNYTPTNVQQYPQSDTYSGSFMEGGADPSTLTQAQQEELEMYYRKGTDQHLTFLRHMREAHAMYPFTGKRDKELFDKALAEICKRSPVLAYDIVRLDKLFILNSMSRMAMRKKKADATAGQFKYPSQGGRGGQNRQQFHPHMQQYSGSYPGTPNHPGQQMSIDRKMSFEGGDSYMQGHGEESFDYTQDDSRDTQHSHGGGDPSQSLPAGFHGAFTNNGADPQGTSAGDTAGNGQHKSEPPDIKPVLPPVSFLSGGDFELIEIEEDDDEV